MRIAALLRFSWKNLWVHRLRSLLTIGGVVIGVGAIVFLISLGFGLERVVTSQVANFSAFSIIDVPASNPPSGKIDEKAIERARAIPHITEVERIIDLAGRVRLADQNSTNETVVVGVTPKYFDLASIMLTNGKMYDGNVSDQVVVNEALAKMLGYEADVSKILDQSLLVDLIIAKSMRVSDETEGPIVKENIALKVIGVVNESTNPVMYVPQKLTDAQGVVNSTSIKIKVDDKLNVAVVRKQIENSGFATEYVGDTVDQITSVFSIFRLILGGFGAIALVVAAIGTFNTLTISLMERIREVALLKMLGMKRADVFRLFIGESITIGILGGGLGAGGGLGLGIVANMLIARIAARSGADVVQIFYTPTTILIYMIAGAIVVGFITGLYPSYRAIKTNPLDALRYE